VDTEIDTSQSNPSAVEPSAWALQSLSRFVEDYRCATPLPISLNPATQATNRYEIASLLAACLEHLGDRTLNPDEKQTLQTLRSEFSLELATLQGNSAAIPAWRIATDADQIAFAPAHWFSTAARTEVSTEKVQTILPPLHWQVQDGNFRFRGILIAAESPLQPSGATFRSLRCTLASCDETRDPYRTTATVEYTRALEANPQNRLVMGLHYAHTATDKMAQNLLGLNAEANFGKVGLFGRYSFALRSTNTPSENLLSDRNLQVWTAGIGIRDFIIPKSLLTLSAGQSPRLNSLQQFAQINYGAFYQFPIGNRLVLSPSIVIMTTPNSSGTVPNVQGALQASFSF
jgi:hypothetical protein